jgi:hypothetical protein
MKKEEKEEESSSERFAGDEEDIRTPDDSKVDRLMTPSPHEDDDIMMAMRESRDMYRRYQERIANDQRKRQALSTELALPISRLRLIHRTTQDRRERDLLHRILEYVYWHTRPIEAEDQSPPSLLISQEMREYIKTMGRMFAPIEDLLSSA